MTKEELKKESEEYNLIIRFKSNKPKYEIRDYIMNHTLNDFDNLQMWDFKRSGEYVESREKRIEELERQKWNDIFLEDCAVYDKKIAEEYTTLEEQIAKLKEENKELKEVHESDKMSLRLIAEKGANLKKVSDKYKEMVKDMKGDMCGTSDITLCNYLIAILKKYGEIV